LRVLSLLVRGFTILVANPLFKSAHVYAIQSTMLEDLFGPHRTQGLQMTKKASFLILSSFNAHCGWL
jgi:hypothetical protein